MMLPSANVTHFERAVSVATGTAILISEWRRRRRLMPTLTGVGMIARGVSGYCPVNSALGRSLPQHDAKHALAGDGGVVLEHTVSVDRTADELYAFWRRLPNLPLVFSHLMSVEPTGPTTSRWQMRGPAGTTFTWDAELINNVKPTLIAWRSLPGADIVSAGSVTFRERARGTHPRTDVTVRMQYDAPGGKAAEALAWLIGESPRQVVREELDRFKTSFG
jgi:uncharacterized membrane protein